MRLAKKMALFGGTGLGLLLLVGMFQSHAQNIKVEAQSPLYTQAFWFRVGQPQAENIKYLQEGYGKAQEQMGREIKEAAWLEFNRGKVQETLGRFIQEGGPEGNVPQEELGSGIAAAGHIRWGAMRRQEALGEAILSVARTVSGEARVVMDRLQEGFGQMILTEAQVAYAASQEAMGSLILQQAQLDYAGGVMASSLQASLRGESLEPISQEVIGIIQRNGGYSQLENFALAVNLLQEERGIVLSPLTVNLSSSPSVGESVFAVSDQGWGGFAEYGFFAITGFIFAMWMAGWMIAHDGAPMPMGSGVEEEEYPEYRKAA